MSFFHKLRSGLSKTRNNLVGMVTGIFTGSISEELFEELEEALIKADVGVTTALFLTERLRARAKEEKLTEAALLRGILEEEIRNILVKEDQGQGLEPEKGCLNIYLLTGVNGAGKTTTIGKLAFRYQEAGYKVLMAAADTFRAAAAEQLTIWAKRAGVDIIKQHEGADPGAVVFDACQAAKARKTDVLLIDTAGRLQNKSNLMEELRKIARIVGKEAEDAHVETILVLDAGTGQNAISQARLFGEVTDLSGIILTKLDGTAKGGAVIGIVNETGIPVRMIGVGEAIEDLQEFVPEEFISALFDDDREEEA